jgi:hypothetical protein
MLHLINSSLNWLKHDEQENEIKNLIEFKIENEWLRNV